MADRDFPGASGYLNTASIGLPPAPAAEAMHAAIDDWAAGRATAPGYDVYVHNVGLANALCDGLGMPPSNSAIVSVERPGAAAALAAAGLRAGGLTDAARICFHLYNDED